MKEIKGGVAAPKGFRASGIHCGIRKNRLKRDVALIVSEVRAAAAGVYTQNLVKGAPVVVTGRHLADGYASAVICNSGNANTCNADGEAVAEKMCGLVEEFAGIPARDVIVASTGVIGQPLDLSPIRDHMSILVSDLGDNSGDAAEAIMTTDLAEKQMALEFSIGGVPCRIGGIAKGSGMIHPNMATMLIFLTSDVAIEPRLLRAALSEDVKDSLNMVSVDGDTSTSDMMTILANGMAGNPVIDAEGADYETFREALRTVTVAFSKMIARDGEGATKLIECNVSGGKTVRDAKIIAKSVICSSLVKTAMYGADANWGRVLCAIGYSGADADVKKVDVSFRSKAGEIGVCRDGAGIPFSEDRAKGILSEDTVQIDISLKSGDGEATAWGCDLTGDYVEINSDYRT